MSRPICKFIQCLPPRDYERVERAITMRHGRTPDMDLLIEMNDYCARLEERARQAELNETIYGNELRAAFWRWFLEPVRPTIDACSGYCIGAK